jgi:predicted nuclease of predicted toxin-antitoxin system
VNRVLLDQGLPRGAVALLKHSGWHVVHTGDIGLSRATDRQIVEHARKERLVIVTLDADFHAIIAVENASSPSIVRVRREGLNAHALTSLLIEVWPAVSDQLQSGALVTIDDRSVRVRSIPIQHSQ